MVHNPLDAVLENTNVEVDQETDLSVGSFQVRQKLSFMNGHQLLYRLNLDNQFVLNQQIEPIGAIETKSLIVNRKAHLPLEVDTSAAQLKAETLIVSRLEQAGTKVPMHFDRRPDHPLRQLVLRHSSLREISASPRLRG